MTSWAPVSAVKARPVIAPCGEQPLVQVVGFHDPPAALVTNIVWNESYA